MNKEALSTNKQFVFDGYIAILNSLEESHPKNKGNIGRLKNKFLGKEISDSEIKSEMTKLSQCLIQEKDEDSRAFRIATSEIRSAIQKMATSSHLSSEQRNLIEQTPLHKGDSTADSIASLGRLCLAFANESIHLRKSSKVVVGDEHQHIQQKSGNVIAGDISWSSKHIVKSILPLLKRVHAEHPERKQLLLLVNEAETLRKKSNIDFFDALKLMENATREVAVLQGKKESADTEYLKTFHLHLKGMHESLKQTIENNAIFADEQSEGRSNFNKIMTNFKDASESENDPLKLKSIIAKNIESLSASFSTVMARQDAHIRNQQRELSELSSEIRAQEKQHSEAVEARNKMIDLVEEMSTASMVDHLTEIPNRRAYEKELGELDDYVKNIQGKELSRFGVAVIDVDHFKKINDNFGHVYGDKILKFTAGMIKGVINKSGLSKHVHVYRYGGEEFVLIYRGLSLLEMSKLLELIRVRLGKVELKASTSKKTCITVSSGVATYSLLDKKGSSVFELADKAMYHAKKTGRNRLVISFQQRFKKLQRNNNNGLEIIDTSA